MPDSVSCAVPLAHRPTGAAVTRVCMHSQDLLSSSQARVQQLQGVQAQLAELQQGQQKLQQERELSLVRAYMCACVHVCVCARLLGREASYLASMLSVLLLG